MDAVHHINDMYTCKWSLHKYVIYIASNIGMYSSHILYGYSYLWLVICCKNAHSDTYMKMLGNQWYEN